MCELGAAPASQTHWDGGICNCYDLNVIGASHSLSCIRYADRGVDETSAAVDDARSAVAELSRVERAETREVEPAECDDLGWTR